VKELATIFDIHSHCSNFKDDGLRLYARLNGLKYDLRELLECMDQAGIFGALLLSPPLKSGSAAPNSHILKLCDKSDGKLNPVLTVEPSQRSVEECKSVANKNKGFVKGFKIRLGYVPVYADDQVFQPLYDFAESEELPVMFHTGDTALQNGSLKHAHPLTLDALASNRSNLKIVICHFGNPWIMDAAELVYKHRNVYADISGLFTGGGKYSAKYLDSLVKRVSEAIYYAGDADKILFGTDYPVETHQDAVGFTERLPLDKEDLEKIFSKNAKKVFAL
jgi:predicted TIM-barrel fold metal-dependent hydrolase